MTTIRTYVFAHLADGPAPAGLLTLVDEPRNAYASFAYGRRYLERPDRVPVDPVALPLPEAGVEHTFRTEEDFAVFGGVRDAMPDGWGQFLMYKAMNDRLPTTADLLLASGDDRVGVLAFGPTPAAPERITPWGGKDAPDERFSLEELAEAVLRVQDVDHLDENLRRLLTAGSSLGGARPKAATEVDGQPWLAKFPMNTDTAPLCRVELATMRLAAQCGLDVPALAFRRAFDRDIYLIQRFDRRRDGNRLDRTPFVSGLTVLGAHERDVRRHSYADLAGAIRRYGAAPRQDLRELFARMVFNILVTNDDDHLRNHGFLWSPAGWRLSPLYDVVPKPQVGHDRRLVLGVGPQGRAATIENALAGAAQFGLDAEGAASIVMALCETVRTGWRPAFEAAGVGREDCSRFATCFRLADPALKV